jgi:hypothetical protein
MKPETIQALIVIWAGASLILGVLFGVLSMTELKPKSQAERDFDRQAFAAMRANPKFRSRYQMLPVEWVEENPFLTADREYTRRGVVFRRLAKVFAGVGATMFVYSLVRPMIASPHSLDSLVSTLPGFVRGFFREFFGFSI